MSEIGFCSISWEWMDRISIRFYLLYIIDKIYVCIEKGHFLQICNRVTALDLCQKLFFAQYLENGWTEFNQILYTHYFWQGLGWFFIYLFFFPQICNGVMALDWCQKLVFAQYLDNECREFNQILYIYYHWYYLSTISASNRVVLLNISLCSDSAMAGLWSDPVTTLVFAGNKNNH